MSPTITELEKQDIELQLQEIQLKRQLNKIEREKITKNELKNALQENNTGIIMEDIQFLPSLHLHYNKSDMEKIPRIADIYPNGSIKIFGKNNSEILTKKYTMKSLLWIRGNLEKWSDKQRKTTGFFKIVAEKYSKRFVKISYSKIASLCYLVDSGKADVWFEKYESLQNECQSTLKI